MKSFRWALIALAMLSLVLGIKFLIGFPWSGTLQALEGADWLLLAGASLTNLFSLSAKAWAWHLLLRPAAPHRWRTAQAATFVGAAASSVSVSVSGEAARLQVVTSRDGAAMGATIASLVWSRIVEAMALVLFLAGALAFLPGGGWVETARIATWAILATALALWALGAWPWLVRRLPERWRVAVQLPAAPGNRGWIVAPLALSLVNWLAQWLTYHWAIAATHVSNAPGISLSALVMANIGGILRLTPGNVGVLQASLMFGMSAFGIPPEQSLAAGMALQAVQVLPVIALGVALVGMHGFRQIAGKRAAQTAGAL